MEIKLTIESATRDETQELNVSNFLLLSTVCDAVTLYNAMSRSLVTIGQVWEERWDEIIPLHASFDGQEMDIERGAEWLWELAQLVTFIDEDGSGKPAEAYLAYLYECGWKWVDFNDIEDWTNNFVSGEEGKDEYARTHYEDQVHEDVVNYVDWDSVGDELFSAFTVYEFNGLAYYFNE